MSFLQPWLLAALPIISLPIIIHLINQRRYQTVKWAAMMFLLAANKMSRGYARLRQYLIMAMRIAAIAALIFAISRPLTGGWLGRATGGKPDVTLVLLDRSPSMTQRGQGTGDSKLETGRRQLAESLKTIGSARWVLIENGDDKPKELETIDALATSPSAQATSATSDLPAMLLSAHEYIKANKPGRAEVWILSDIRENDWNAEGGRWQTLRDAFQEFSQSVRFHLLAYPQPAPGDLAIRVTEARRQKTGDGAELFVSLKVTRQRQGRGSADADAETQTEARQTVPIQFEVNGARSEVNIELTGLEYELKDHRIPLGPGSDRGWGKVTIPADSAPADNEFYFAFSQPSPRKTIVVGEDPQASQPLQLAAGISPDPAITSGAEVVAETALGSIDWDQVALLLWQAQLPDGDSAAIVKAFLDRGGDVIFFPPRSPNDTEFLGMSWTSWTGGPQEVPVETWRSDQDLLAITQSGTALPVGKLQVRRYCGLKGEATPLATLKGNDPLLARPTTNRGAAYFCATTPAPGDSTMATEGVVFYVMVQRALASGAAVLQGTRQLVAGDPGDGDSANWTRLAGDEDSVSIDYPLHAGVYRSGDRLLAVNRSEAEDTAGVLADARVANLFKGLDFSRVDDQAGSMGSLIQEIWRLFLAAMMVAMMVEAGLCLPRKPVAVPETMSSSSRIPSGVAS